MKKTVLIVTALLMSVMVYSQRQELREASRSINNKDFNTAKQALSKIEGQIEAQDASTQAEFYLYKGQAFAGSAKNNVQDLKLAAESFKKVIDLEKSGRQRHTQQATTEIQNLISVLVNSAIEDQSSQRFSTASSKLLTSYNLSKSDTVYLYFAAINAANAKEYDNAVNFYETLLDLGYTGIEKEYYITEKATGEEVQLESQQEQLFYIRTGEYERPVIRNTKSRQPQILSDLVLIYTELGKIEKARSLIKDAQKSDPNNVALIQAEANIALQMEDMKTYNELMQKIIKTDPKNPDIYYNLGVSSASIGDIENAKKYYEQALKIDPNNTNSKINLAVLILDKESTIIEEMNSLGTSAADNRRYDQLRKERDNIYLEAVPLLESALNDRPNSQDIMRTLMNIYSILGEDSKFRNIRERLEALEN